jgi:glycosyltransferase involved in cell wall biosynthesis
LAGCYDVIWSKINVKQYKICGRYGDLPMDLVSVVIPAYNSEKWIKTTLNSVLAQSYPELEIIVVDDGSGDRTAVLAEQTLCSFPGSWKVLRQANKGEGAARNSGWRTAHGSWIQFLDSDDVLAPEKIKLQMAVAQEAPHDIAVIFSSWQRVAEKEGQLLPVEEAQTPQLDCKPPPASLLISKNNIQIGSILVRREWLESSQGFTEQMPIYADTEFLIRIATAGGGFRLAPSSEPLLLWRMFPEQPRWGNEAARYRLKDVAKTWLGLVLRTASNGRIESCGLSAVDREDLIADCTMFLRNLYRYDRATFREYLASVRRFVPGYIPKKPIYLWLMAKCLGYERSEAVAAIIRPIKQLLQRS